MSSKEQEGPWAPRVLQEGKTKLLPLFQRTYKKECSRKFWKRHTSKVRVKVSVQSLSCTTLYNLMDCSTPGFLVHHQLPELAQTHVHRVGDAIQPSHPLLSPSLPAFNLSQHQGLFQCQFFTPGSQSIGASASASVSQWIFRTELRFRDPPFSSVMPLS